MPLLIMSFQSGNCITKSDRIKEADAIRARISNGAGTTLLMANAFWGDCFGAPTDEFGTQWMVISPIE
jgi:uncharacterized glyoxalase superfamily protein PhnB